MTPSLPSCIRDTFCSHRQASWFLLATLSPFFLPFLILCVPFLLLFLAPVSVFLFSLLLLYKVQVSVCPKLKRSYRRADKGEGYQPTQRISAAQRLDIHQQAPLEEDRQFKGLEGSNVQSAETHTHHKEGGVCILPSRVVCDFEEEKLGHLEEDLVGQDGITEDKIEQKQEEQDIIEGPLVEEGREGRSPGGFPEPEVSNVQNVELLASNSKARAEDGLQSTKRESSLTEETQEDMGKVLLRNDRMEDNKQEEEESTEELIDITDEQKHSLDATSSRTSEENRTSPMTYEGESLDTPYSYDHRSSVVSLEDRNERLDTPYSYDHRSSVPVEQQGQVSSEDRNESSHMHPLEEAWSKLPAIQVTEPNFQAKTTVFPDHIIDKPCEELNEEFEIDTSFMEIVTHEHLREEPELSSKKDPSLEILGIKGRPDKKKDIFFPPESFEKETEEGEGSYSSPEGHDGQWRPEAFSEETRDDEEPQKGSRPTKNLAVSFEAESLAEREEGYPSVATSSTVPPPHVSHGGIEFQDRIQEEQKIMADINAIKKIIGYQGEPHASILEQISALYMFLGMEPYNWGAEVDNLERAQVEIELLKVVVGVK